MAKVSAPLMSLSASGTIAEALTFSKRASGQQVRWQRKQKDVITPDRIINRSNFLLASLACRFWQYGEANYGASVYGVSIDDLNNEAKGLPLSGYNLGIKQLLSVF